MPSQGRILTPEQIALSEARKKKKAEAAAKAVAAATVSSDQQKSSILSRIFLSKSPSDLNIHSQCNFSIPDQSSIMSWNMLAQCLVRRELFPTSDCLRASQRDGMLIEEITRSGAELICLQEVDRLEKIGPALETAGYSYVFTSGPKKKHGCLVAFKRMSYKLAAQKTIFYDDTEVHPSSTEGELLNLNISQVGRKGSSFRTKNIGLIVALKRVTRINNDIIENQNAKGSEEQDSNKIRVGDNDTNGNENDDKNKDINNKNNDDDNGELGKKTGAVDEGFDKEDPSVVVATTHLFWHPRYTYERARQSLILVRSVCEFKKDNNISDAPSFIAGDFNFGPSDAVYSLLVGDPLTPEQEQSIKVSHVVHHSIDPTIPISDASSPDDEDEGAAAGGEEEDVVEGESKEGEGIEGSKENKKKEPKTGSQLPFKNARQAIPSDGLLSATELEHRFKLLPRLRSAYDEWGSTDPLRTFGARVPVLPGRRGGSEPMYTSYTHYWKTTLDYIFVMTPPDRELKILGVLEPPVEGDLGTGLPRKDVCGSDHIAVRAHIAWPRKS